MLYFSIPAFSTQLLGFQETPGPPTYVLCTRQPCSWAGPLSRTFCSLTARVSCPAPSACPSPPPTPASSSPPPHLLAPPLPHTCFLLLSKGISAFPSLPDSSLMYRARTGLCARPLLRVWNRDLRDNPATLHTYALVQGSQALAPPGQQGSDPLCSFTQGNSSEGGLSFRRLESSRAGCAQRPTRSLQPPFACSAAPIC